MDEALREKLKKLMAWHAPLRRGAMSFAQLRNLARRIGELRSVVVRVKLEPWPFSGTVAWIGEALVIRVDSRLSPGDQLDALAHEVGHLALGHYNLREREVWYLQDNGPDDLWEQEAEVFVSLATRSPGSAAWAAALNDQLPLGIER
jgi:hypothetical protein